MAVTVATMAVTVATMAVTVATMAVTVATMANPPNKISFLFYFILEI
jgi:hypothetical protein